MSAAITAFRNGLAPVATVSGAPGAYGASPYGGGYGGAYDGGYGGFAAAPTLGQVGHNQPLTSVNMHPGTQVVTPAYNSTVYGVPNRSGGPTMTGFGAQTGFNPMVANPYPIITPGATAYGAGYNGAQTTLPNAPFPLSGTWPTIPQGAQPSMYGSGAPAIANYNDQEGGQGFNPRGLLKKRTPLATSASRTSRTVTPYNSVGPTSLGAVPFNPAHGNYTRYPLGDVKKRYIQQY